MYKFELYAKLASFEFDLHNFVNYNLSVLWKPEGIGDDKVRSKVVKNSESIAEEVVDVIPSVMMNYTHK